MMIGVLAGAPAAAQTASSSSARTQVTVSARIISGESVSLGASAQQRDKKPGLTGTSGSVFALARTQGKVALDGQSQVLVTEFH